jgi:hypothetical protein
MDAESSPVSDTPIDPPKDWLLAFLVGLANDAGVELDITVVADGAVISGRLVSMQRWLTLNADRFPAGEVAQVLSDHLRDIALSVTPGKDDSDEEPEQTGVAPSYIHLTDARFVHGDGIVPNDCSLLWRGRLSRVTGWSLGAFRAGPAQSD